MSKSKDISIIDNPSQYLDEQKQTLDQRIDNIRLKTDIEEEIAKSKAVKLVRDKILGLFKVGEIANEILKWNESLEQDIRNAKKNVLIEQYFDKNDRQELAIHSLTGLLSSAQGSVLFTKIVHILDDRPPDRQLIEHLSSALRYIADSDFVGLFEAHRYALAQIEQVSAQALAILADEKMWPRMTLGSYSANGSRVESDWLSQFSAAYSDKKGVFDQAMSNRVKFSIGELQTRKFIEAHLAGDGGVAQCRVTEIGALLLPYISSDSAADG